MGGMDIKLKKQIMRRVYIVAFMRRFLRPFVLKSSLLVVAVSLGASFVSVTNVIRNGITSSSGVFDLFAFMFRALSRAEIFVQVLFVMIVFLALWMVIDKIRELEHGHMSVV